MESIGEINIQVQWVVDDLVQFMPNSGNVVMTRRNVFIHLNIVTTYTNERSMVQNISDESHVANRKNVKFLILYEKDVFSGE